MSSNSVCSHTCDKQIGFPLRGRPILLITRMITDRIGLHSVLLPLLIIVKRMFLFPCFFYLISHLSFYRSKITEEGGVLMAQNVPSRVMIPPKAVPTCTEVTCFLWNLQILSPPLGRNEALVSSVMELACGNLPGTEERYEFNVKVKVALSHSASDIKGYELVIKELTNEKTNDWRDLKTRWAWTPSGSGYVGNLQGTAILP